MAPTREARVPLGSLHFRWVDCHLWPGGRVIFGADGLPLVRRVGFRASESDAFIRETDGAPGDLVSAVGEWREPDESDDIECKGEKP